MSIVSADNKPHPVYRLVHLVGIGSAWILGSSTVGLMVFAVISGSTGYGKGFSSALDTAGTILLFFVLLPATAMASFVSFIGGLAVPGGGRWGRAFIINFSILVVLALICVSAFVIPE